MLLEVDPRRGLEDAAAMERLARHGENRLAEKPPRSRWLMLLDQFRSLLILVLIVAAFLAWLIGDIKDAVVILAVVLLNALLGFYQEGRAGGVEEDALTHGAGAPRRPGAGDRG